MLGQSDFSVIVAVLGFRKQFLLAVPAVRLQAGNFFLVLGLLAFQQLPHVFRRYVVGRCFSGAELKKVIAQFDLGLTDGFGLIIGIGIDDAKSSLLRDF